MGNVKCASSLTISSKYNFAQVLNKQKGKKENKAPDLTLLHLKVQDNFTSLHKLLDSGPTLVKMALRQKQLEMLKGMLNFNSPKDDESTQVQAQWKVLLYDDFCRDIIALLMNVGELRNEGVTLHLHMSVDRTAIPDVPAIYFSLPTTENVEIIAKDMESGLYDAYHLNFASSAPVEMVERIAARAVECGCSSQVAAVWDQYLSYICLESNLFSFNMLNSFSALHDPTLLDYELENTVDFIVTSLFGVAAAEGVVPVIQCQRGGPAEMVARSLDEKLRDHLKSRVNLFSESQPSASFGFRRPALIICDRMVDVGVMLHHTWTYQALAHDLLELRLNRVTIDIPHEGEHEDAHPVQKTYDLEQTDKFWQKNSGLPFPMVAEEVEKQVGSYTEAYEKMTRSADAIGSAAVNVGESSTGDGHTATQQLASAISSLPVLTERKRQIDLHTSLATALLNQIKDRQLDNYFSTEENLMMRGVLDMPTVMEILLDTQRGTPEDKERLACIVYMCTPDMTPETLQEMTDALTNSGCGLSALNYFKRERTINSLVPMVSRPSKAPNSGEDYRSRLGKMGTAFFDLADKAYSKGMTGMINSMKQLLPSNKNLPLTKIVESLMEMKQSPETQDFLYMDPKLPKEASYDSARMRAGFKAATVFVVGGGNYVEYHNLEDMASKHGCIVTYGGTEICSPNNFLKQLQVLGDKSK